MSANGQQYSSDDTRFVQYPPPPARTLLPSGGPIDGGTTAELTLTLTRYGGGGVNYAHQDQNSSPWQAALLLNSLQP